jgi:ABC-type antimicrobial peptide transport system permease subunit
MSFTVARRTAEIGIRLALGASPRRVVLATFGRALLQVGLGLLVGAIPAALLAINLGPGISATAERQEAIAACIVATLVVAGITSVASLVPVRRALHIQPVDALKVS